jgi:hypothetical protein
LLVRGYVASGGGATELYVRRAGEVIIADTRLTRIGPLRSMVLCLYAAFAPKQLADADVEDDRVRGAFPKPAPPERPRAYKVNRALWSSLLWVACSVVVGFLTGRTIRALGVAPAGKTPLILQVAGAMLLLWGTLFVRGWDIQSWGGVTLTERVNRWLFRFLYCLGTAAVVASLSLPV